MQDFDIQTFTYNPDEFSLGDTLASGQCFRWKRREGGWWLGVVGRAVVGVKQDGEQFSWWTYPEAGNWALVQDYFQLDVDLGEIVERIAEADPKAGEAAHRWSGLRLLRQEPEGAHPIVRLLDGEQRAPHRPLYQRVQQALWRNPGRGGRA